MSTKYLFRHNLNPFWLSLYNHPYLRNAESTARLILLLLFNTEDEWEEVDEVELFSKSENFPFGDSSSGLNFDFILSESCSNFLGELVLDDNEDVPTDVWVLLVLLVNWFSLLAIKFCLELWLNK